MAAKVGKYLLFETLGVGTFGKVKLGVHEETGEQVAVKIMDKTHIQRQDLTLQVRREIAIMKALKHKNIVNLHQVLTSANKLYIVMDLVTGGELFDIIANKGEGGLGEEVGRGYFQQMVDGVLYCHRRGVYHRDLKPENLLLNTDNVLKITDFGLSAIKGADTATALFTTQCGTPSYVAPEIIDRADKGYSGEKVDAWAAGIILFALMCGYLPFDGADMPELFSNISNSEVEYPDWVSDGAKDLMTKLLEKNATRRWTLRQVRDHPWFKVNYDDDEDTKRKSKSRRHRKHADNDVEIAKHTHPDHSTPPVSLRDAARPYNRKEDKNGRQVPELPTPPNPMPPPPPRPPVVSNAAAAPSAAPALGPVVPAQEATNPTSATPSLPEAPAGLLPSRASFAQQSRKWQSLRKSIVTGETVVPPVPQQRDSADEVAQTDQRPASLEATAPQVDFPAPVPIGATAERPQAQAAKTIVKDEDKPMLSSLSALNRSEYRDRPSSTQEQASSLPMSRDSGSSDRSMSSRRNRTVRTSMLLSATLGDALKGSTATAAVAGSESRQSSRDSNPSASKSAALEQATQDQPPSTLLSALEEDDDDDETFANLNDEELERVQAIRQLKTVIVMSRTRNLGVDLQGDSDFERVLNLWSSLERKDIKDPLVLANEKSETLEAVRLIRNRLRQSKDRVPAEEQRNIRDLLDLWEAKLEGRDPHRSVDQHAIQTFVNFEVLLNIWDESVQANPVAEDVDIPDSVQVEEEVDVFLPEGVTADHAQRRNGAGPTKPAPAYTQESIMLLSDIPEAPQLPDTSLMSLNTKSAAPYSQESMLLLNDIPEAPQLPGEASVLRLSSESEDHSPTVDHNAPKASRGRSFGSIESRQSSLSQQSTLMLDEIPEAPPLPEDAPPEAMTPDDHKNAFSFESMLLLDQRPEPPELPPDASLLRLPTSELAPSLTESSVSLRSSVDDGQYPEVPDLPEFQEQDSVIEGPPNVSRKKSLTAPISTTSDDTAPSPTESPGTTDPTAKTTPRPVSEDFDGVTDDALGPVALRETSAEPAYPDRTANYDNRPTSGARRPLGARRDFDRMIPRDSLYDSSELTEAERLEILDDDVEVDDIPDYDEDELRQQYLNSAWRTALSPARGRPPPDVGSRPADAAPGARDAHAGHVKFADQHVPEEPESPNVTRATASHPPHRETRPEERGTEPRRAQTGGAQGLRDPHSISPTAVTSGATPTVTSTASSGAAVGKAAPTATTVTPVVHGGRKESRGRTASQDGVVPLSTRSHSGGKGGILNKLFGRKEFTSGFPLEKCFNEMGKLLTSLHCEVIRKRGEFKLKAVAPAAKGTKVQASIEMTSESSGRTLVLFKKARAEFGKQADTQTFLEFYHGVVDNFNQLGPEAVLND